VTGTVLVLGGRSEIGVALACRLAATGRARTVVLAARRASSLEAEAAAIRAAGAPVVRALEFDADVLAAQPALLDSVARVHGEPDVVVLAPGPAGELRLRLGEGRARRCMRRHTGPGSTRMTGVLADQARAEHDAEHATAVLHTDYVAQVAALTRIVIGSPRCGSRSTPWTRATSRRPRPRRYPRATATRSSPTDTDRT